MKDSRHLLAAALIAAFASAAGAIELQGEVVGVADGDTITVLDATKRQHKIRLQGIDAPEKGQPFGDRAKQHLSALVFGKPVRVEWSKRDRYGRVIGVVWVASPDCTQPPCTLKTDAGLAQLTQGLAWWFHKYAHEQPAPQRDQYEAAEAQSRADQRGLWAQPAPQPPWDYRKERAHEGRH